MTDSAQCDVHDFLNSMLFETDHDVDNDIVEQRFRLETLACTEYTEFTVDVRGYWHAKTKSGVRINGGEKIGYHPYTVELLQAVLNADCEFWVYRADGKHDMRQLQEARRAEHAHYSKAFNDTFGPLMRAAARTVLS